MKSTKNKTLRLKPTNTTPYEHAEQVTVFSWAEYAMKRWPCLAFMYAVPNGARTNSQSQANKLKAEGMKSGVPDLVLPFPIRVSADSDQWFHGLYIEMKRQKGGRLSENQSNYMAYLKSVGYCVLVCAGAEQAVNTIKTYLTNPEALLDFEH